MLRRAVPFQVGRRRAQHAMIRRKMFGDQMRGDLVADANVEIEAFAGNVDETIEQIEPHAQLRMTLREAFEDGSDDFAAEAEAARDAQRAARHLARRGDVLDELIDVVENLLGPRVDAL